MYIDRDFINQSTHERRRSVHVQREPILMLLGVTVLTWSLIVAVIARALAS